MLIIMIVTFVEPTQFGILFPFIYFMIKDFNVTEHEKELGSYVYIYSKCSGLLASSFCIAQLVTSLPWGYISDRIGRRPVVIMGLLGTSITGCLFGISETDTTAV